ncbi:hypothetical protein HH310_21615 [Actinoplanes sp. TBRC 11911]|uniref:hemopexin repeat-containing protein n=1 Tax=Actinoplanes sp. TBRC 11911 TaxID=2729386 RepID=UPI00145DA803|nr:hemopexin repeat-containing protein [Actinoplanes sp. TBRC 11911]NMO53768.1 hypothetical protein [Actinoplanes sp. TBRC 11911]
MHLFRDGWTASLRGRADAGSRTAERWGVQGPALPSGTVDAALAGRDGHTYLFSGDQYLRYTGTDYSFADIGYPRGIAADWGGLTRIDTSFVLDGATYLFGDGRFVRYSTADYTTPDDGFPQPVPENWWNLPGDLARSFDRVDAVLVDRDRLVYLFRGNECFVQDLRRRPWRPSPLKEQWDSLPFAQVDAAFATDDGRTYVFSGDRFVRYSDPAHTRLDDGFPAMISAFWGKTVNLIASGGRVDAALALDDHTYLFSGDQFVRYTGTAYETVDGGYPRLLSALNREPRLTNLAVELTGVDAAFADRGTVYLVSGEAIHAVSATAYRRYADLVPDPPGCLFADAGGVYAEHQAGGWHHYNALEGPDLGARPDEPDALRTVPQAFRTGLDAVLTAPDGNVHLFKGTTCFDGRLRREQPIVERWGRARNTIDQDNSVDAAFVGVDGKTYVFSGDQFVVYAGPRYAGVVVDDGPLPVADHWGGLTGVALAYVQEGVTYLFEPPGPGGEMRYVAYSGPDYATPDGGEPRWTGPEFWNLPRHDTQPVAVLSTGGILQAIAGDMVMRYDPATGTWSSPRPFARTWPGIDDPAGLRTAFTGLDGTTYFFLQHEFIQHSGRAAIVRGAIREQWGLTRTTDVVTVDAAVVAGEHTFVFSGDRYARYSDIAYLFPDTGYPKPIVGNLRRETAFANLPAAFDDELARRFAAGNPAMIDAAVARGRTTYLFTGRTCHAVSTSVTATYATERLTRV